MPMLPNAVITISRISDFDIAEGSGFRASGIEFTESLPFPDRQLGKTLSKADAIEEAEPPLSLIAISRHEDPSSRRADTLRDVFRDASEQRCQRTGQIPDYHTAHPREADPLARHDADVDATR